jgi:hypothetical protein
MNVFFKKHALIEKEYFIEYVKIINKKLDSTKNMSYKILSFVGYTTKLIQNITIGFKCYSFLNQNNIGVFKWLKRV